MLELEIQGFFVMTTYHVSEHSNTSNFLQSFHWLEQLPVTFEKSNFLVFEQPPRSNFRYQISSSLTPRGPNVSTASGEEMASISRIVE